MNGDGFVPHGYSVLWRPWVLWLYVTSDAFIGVSCVCITLVLAYFFRRRADLPFLLIFWLFAAFILLCGVSHFIGIWVVWYPDYYIQALTKAAVAAVSLTMLGALIFYVPRAFELVSSAQLAAQNEKLTRQVEKSEERGRVKLGAVVDNIFDGVITIGEDGIIQSFNPACTLLFGYEPGEVIGQDVKMLMPHPHRATHDGYVRNYLDTGIGRIIGGGGREVAGLRKDGSSFPLDLSITSFTVDGVRCFTGCLRDVTKQKSAMDERELLLSRLTNSNAELERFAYVASHDMQEPVRMMLSFSKLLEEDYAGVLDQEGQDYLKIIGSSALRMQNMIRDLMDYARLDGERREFAAIDLRQASTTVEENLRQLIS